MYAGHFAAGLAIKSAEPPTPMAALMGMVFLPDLLWLGLSISGVETVGPDRWFDGWSHSIASIVLQAILIAAVWKSRGHRVAAALACAVLSHLILDLPSHPAPLQWYPHSAASFGNFLHGWAGQISMFGKAQGWWVEMGVVIAGSAIYLARTRRLGISKAAAGANVILVVSLQIAFG